MKTNIRIAILLFAFSFTNLRNLIAATGLVILLKLDSNGWFFSPCDLEIWWMTLKNNTAPLLCYYKLFVSFHSHWWIQTGVTVWKRLIWVKIGDFFSRVTLHFDRWPWKTIGHLFYATSSLVLHFVVIGEFKLELQSGNTQSGSNLTIFFCRVTLKFDGRMTLKNNRAPLLSNIKLYASFVNSNWSYGPETVKLGCDLCDLDLWPWPFAWTSLLSLVITPANFIMIWWGEHSAKGVTDRQTDIQTDGQTDGLSHS